MSEDVLRPQWLDGWLDYPHGLLCEKQARQLIWYTQAQSERVKALEAELLEHKNEHWCFNQEHERMEAQRDEALGLSQMDNAAMLDLIKIRNRLEAEKAELLEAIRLMTIAMERADAALARISGTAAPKESV